MKSLLASRAITRVSLVVAAVLMFLSLAFAITWGSLVVAAVLFFLSLVLLLWVGYTRAPHIFGFGSYVVKTTTTYEYQNGTDEPDKRTVAEETQSARTVWEWLTILTISAVIAGMALWFANRQAEQQTQLQIDQAEDREAIQILQANDEALQTYLDQMTEMILDDEDPLLQSRAQSVRGLTARSRTLTALKRLDAEHNEIVVTFLRESDLVNFSVPGDQKKSVVRLDQADLNDVDLANISLGGFDLRFVDLNDAILHDASFAVTNLIFADLAGADLRNADLRDTDLQFANLERANLEGANFSNARLDYVNLSGANLKNAKNLTQEQISQAWWAKGTIKNLPGHLHRPEWWSYRDPILRQPEIPRFRAWDLGVSVVTLKHVDSRLRTKIGLPTRQVGTNAALVISVHPDSPAKAAGLQAGDIIDTVGQGSHEGQVQGLQNLKHRLAQYQSDESVRIGTWRRYFREGWENGTVYARLRN